MDTKIKISIISPVYNAENILEELVKQIDNNISKITNEYEIIFIEDCSPDNSWDKIKQLSYANSKIKGFKFSRNFGQHAAIKAGLSVCKGDVAIVMDCDLQDNPKYIKDLYEEYQNGFDIVYTEKTKRKHSLFKNITAKIFNRVFNYLTDNKNVSSNNNIGAYSLLNRKVINEFINYNDYQFHYLLVLRWLGFNFNTIKIEHNERLNGKSSYNLKKLMEHAIVGIVYQSDKLLRINIYLGAIIAGSAFFFGVYVLIKSFFIPLQSGWASLIILISFSLGVILMSLGIVGLYIGKTFEQAKNRKHYIISEKTN